jgi:cytochrome c5
LKVDVDALPSDVRNALRKGDVDLDDPAVTLLLLREHAVVGVTGFFAESGQIQSIGIQCSLCHSTVDDSFAPGIGQRLDGWANRDLDVGKIIAFAPDLSVLTTLLGKDLDTVLMVLNAWGPGKFDAALVLDGQGFNGDNSAATLIPPAFGLAGVNLHTWTGWGSVTHWNAFVANLEMHGKGRFYDPRLNDPEQFQIAAANNFGNIQIDPEDDRITPKLAALHFYQLAIPAPDPPEGSFDAAAADRGRGVFRENGCQTCHVDPIFTEPGWNMHTPDEVCVESFQADRSPDRHYRTAPLAGLFSHQKGGFYHDGRFATLADVIDHYEDCFDFQLGEEDQNDLIEYLKSL